jgi:hypothetical protein
MSWDLFVMDLPPGIKSVAEIPKDFKPRPLGQRSDLIKKISAIFPETNFSDPSWGVLVADGCSIELFSMGSHEEVESFAMHVRGGNECPNIVAHVLEVLGMRALDTSSDSGLFEQDPDHRSDSFNRWRAYRSHIDELLNGPKK